MGNAEDKDLKVMMMKVAIARILNAAKHSQWGNEMKGKRNWKYISVWSAVTEHHQYVHSRQEAERHSSEGRVSNVKAYMFWLTLPRT